MDALSLLVLAGVGALALLAIGTYNGLVGRRNRVAEAASQIDVQLKRRFDLIPNLIEAVRGQMKFESGTLERITQARAGVSAAGDGITPARVSAENALGGIMAGLRVQMEAYPTLGSNQNVLALQEQLASTENQISFARQHYNACVMEYRNAAQTFPSVLLAGAMGFRADAFAFFDAPPEAETAPRVDLSLS